MAQSLLTPTMVTREILRVAHEKAVFIKTTDQSYDDSYAKTGAKIGSSLKIRQPNKYTVRTGKALAVQDTSETSVTLTLATQKGVDMNFSSAELTMQLDDFSKRIVLPATSVLVSNIESAYLAYVTPLVYNLVGTAGTTPASMLTIGQARGRLNQMLAPQDERCIQMNSTGMAAMTNAYSTLFSPVAAISEQYKEGYITRNGGFDYYENQRIYQMVNGSDVTGSTDASAAVTDGGNTIDMHTLVAISAQTNGEVFTVAGVYACHPETKASLGYLQQFTIIGSSSNNTLVSPTIYLTGANQNVCSSAGAQLATTAFNAQTVTFVGSASTSYDQHLAYYKEAFAFVTADLELPNGVHFAAREQMDGLSIRVVRQYDINNDNIPARLDILHGYEAIRPEWAVRITG